MINLTRYKKFLNKLEKNQKTGLHVSADKVRSDMHALPLIDVVHLYLRSRKIDNAVLEPISLKRPELSRIELFKLIRKQNTDCAKLRDGVGGPLMVRLFKIEDGHQLLDFLNIISDYNPLYHLKDRNPLFDLMVTNPDGVNIPGNLALRILEQIYHRIVAMDELRSWQLSSTYVTIVGLAINHFDKSFSKVLDENPDLDPSYKVFYQGIRRLLDKIDLVRVNQFIGHSAAFEAHVMRPFTADHPYGDFPKGEATMMDSHSTNPFGPQTTGLGESHPYIVDQRIIDEIKARGIEPIVIDGDIQQLYYHQVDAMSVTSQCVNFDEPFMVMDKADVDPTMLESIREVIPVHLEAIAEKIVEIHQEQPNLSDGNPNELA